jgi:hypothetical protein
MTVEEFDVYYTRIVVLLLAFLLGIAVGRIT